MSGWNNSLGGLLYPNIVIEDIVDFHHQIHVGGGPPFFLQFPINCRNRLITLSHIRCNILPVCVFHEPKQLGSVGLEGLLFLDGIRDCVGRRLQQRQLFKARCRNQLPQVKTVFVQKLLRCPNGFQNSGNQLFFIHRWVGAAVAIHIGGVIRQGFPKCLDNANIVYNQTVALPFGYPVCPGNGLHQRVSL